MLTQRCQSPWSPSVYRIVPVEGESKSNIQREVKKRGRESLEALGSSVIIFVFPHAALDSALLKSLDFFYSVFFSSVNNSRVYQWFYKLGDLNLSLASKRILINNSILVLSPRTNHAQSFLAFKFSWYQEYLRLDCWSKHYSLSILFSIKIN